MSRFPDPLAGLVLDFDGVFTDNRVLVHQDGTESVFCNRSDGAALERLRDSGVPILVLSAEVNPVVRARCEKLRLPVEHGVRDKLPRLMAWAAENQIELASIVYVGNDNNDVECLRAVGCGVVVADARPAALAAADVVLGRSGGDAAIAELVDLLLP